MKKEKPSDLLDKLIQEKEVEHEAEGRSLKEELHRVSESLRPVNLIKHAFKELTSTPGIQTGLFNSALCISTGFIAKKAFVGASHSTFKKILGSVIQIMVTNKVTKNADGIRQVAGLLFNKLFSANKDVKKHDERSL